MGRLVRWRAFYKDGTYLDQYINPFDEDEKDQNKYTDIDRSKLVGFQLYQGIKNIRVIVYFHLSEGCRFFLRRRTDQRMNNEIISVVYVTGWEKTLKNGEIQRVVFVISEDGEHVFVLDGWKPELGINAVELLECEKKEW